MDESKRVPAPFPPSNAALEAVATAAKIGLSAIPVIGGALAETINAGVGAVVQRRRDEYVASIAEKVRELSDRHLLDEDHLSENPVFVDTFLQTAQAAVKSSIEEKRIALRNALLNSILPSAPNEDVRALFIRYIDEFSGAHLAILRVLQENPAQVSPNEYAPSLAFSTKVRAWLVKDPTLRDVPVDIFLNELQSRGLIEGPARGGTLADLPTSAVKLTDLGKRFVVFVSEPAETATNA
jgi:hypothetical protein